MVFEVKSRFWELKSRFWKLSRGFQVLKFWGSFGAQNVLMFSPVFRERASPGPLRFTNPYILNLAGLETQTQNAAFFERKRPKRLSWHRGKSLIGGIKASTSTVAALFSKTALTGQRIAMVDMVFLVFTAFPYLP